MKSRKYFCLIMGLMILASPVLADQYVPDTSGGHPLAYRWTIINPPPTAIGNGWGAASYELTISYDPETGVDTFDIWLFGYAWASPYPSTGSKGEKYLEIKIEAWYRWEGGGTPSGFQSTNKDWFLQVWGSPTGVSSYASGAQGEISWPNPNGQHDASGQTGTWQGVNTQTVYVCQTVHLTSRAIVNQGVGMGGASTGAPPPPGGVWSKEFSSNRAHLKVEFDRTP